MLPVKHLNRSLLGSVDLAPSDSVPVTKRVPVEPEIHANLPRLFALPSGKRTNKTTGNPLGFNCVCGVWYTIDSCLFCRAQL